MKGPWKVVLALLLGLPALVGAQPCNSTKGQLAYCNALTDAVRFGFPRYTTVLLPTCGTTNKGAVAYDTTTDTVKYCTGSAWSAVGTTFTGGTITSPILAPAADNCSAVPYSFTSDATTGLCTSAAGTLQMRASGTNLLTVGPTNVTLTSGDLILAQSLYSTAANAGYYHQTNTNGSMQITGGTTVTPGAYLTAYGSTHATKANQLEVDASGGMSLLSGQLLLPDGAFATPAIAWSGSNEGIYRTAGNIYFRTGSATQLIVTNGELKPGGSSKAVGDTSNRWSAGYFGGQTLTTTVTPLWDGAVTWNDSGTTHRLIYGNVTDTASASTSTLVDLQVGGNFRFNVTKAGALNLAAGITFGTGSAVGSTRGYFLQPADGEFNFVNGAATANAGIRSSRIVEVNTTTKAPSATENGEVYTSTGDADGSTITLLNDPTIGSQYCAAVMETQTVTVAPSAGESILYNGTDYTTSCTCGTKGSFACFLAATGGSGAKWVFMNNECGTGKWTCS